MRLELHAEAVEQLLRLVRRHRQVARTQFDELAARAQQVERQRWVVSRGQDEPQARRRGAQELLDRRADLGAADAVEVIHHHDEGLVQLGEAVQQLDDERPGRAGARAGEPSQRRACGRDPVDRGEPLRPERRLGQLGARGQPRDLTRVRREPRCEQRRLPRACRRGDQRQRTVDSLFESVKEPRAVHAGLRRAWDHEIRCRDGPGSLATCGLGRQALLLSG